MARDLAALPKAELHIHLEGSMRRETLIDLCKKYDISVPPDTRRQRFENFNAFVDVYLAACECLREEADLFRLVLEIAEDAAASGARWIEPALSQSLYNKRFGGAAVTLRVLCRAAEEAEKATGVGIGYIVAAERIFPVSQAEELAEIVRKSVTDDSMRICGRPGIIGFGLHGNEEGFPPAPFAKAFSIACENTGIASVPHAGEIAPHPGKGSQSVRDAIRLLQANRIAHGVLAANDEDALRELVQDNGRRPCLDICVSSNYLLNVVSSPEAHPLPKLCQRGVACSINSDDALLFGSTLLSEFNLCRNELKMDDAMLAKCAADSFRYSCAPKDIIEKGLADVDAWLKKEAAEEK